MSKPIEQESPENIARCLNCPHSDCRFRTIQECIKAEQVGRKPRKVGRPNKPVAEIKPVPKPQTSQTGTDWRKAV